MGDIVKEISGDQIKSHYLLLSYTQSGSTKRQSLHVKINKFIIIGEMKPITSIFQAHLNQYHRIFRCKLWET